MDADRAIGLLDGGGLRVETAPEALIDEPLRALGTVLGGRSGERGVVSALDRKSVV